MNSQDECVHKALFPLAPLEIIGSFALFLFSLLTSASGIGGGPVPLSLLVLFFNFRFKNGGPIALTLLSICIITRNLLDMKRKHPGDKQRALVNYDIFQCVAGLAILSAQFGVFFSVLLS